MSDSIFLFDLDSTVTQAEILPTLAKEIGKFEELERLTEATMLGTIPFKESFPYRAGLLKDIPVVRAQEIVCGIPLNPCIADFIRTNHERCFILTGNLDCWVRGILEKLNMVGHCFCSQAEVRDGYLQRIISLVDKDLVCAQILPDFVGVGDGANDLPLIRRSNYGIAFGGIRPVPDCLAEAADRVINDDAECAEVLRSLL